MYIILYYLIMFAKCKTLAYVDIILIPTLLTPLMKVQFNSCKENSQEYVLTCTVVVRTLYPTSRVFRSLTKVTIYEKNEVTSFFKEVTCF